MSIVKDGSPFSAGDAKVFTTVFDQYYPALCYFANRIVLDKETAEDIAANTLLKFWESGNEFAGVYGIKSWLYLTTRNACINHIKRTERVQDVLVEMDNEKKASDFILNQLVRADVLNEIRKEVDALPPKCRNIVVLHYFDELSIPEIAIKLNLSRHTVKNQLARGAKLLRSRINKAHLLATMAFFSNSWN
jgi:RNA polymerase sigma-70 factor (ECF subfamily)